MATLFRIPHGLIRRYFSRVERVIIAGGLAGLLYSLLSGVPALPPFWDGVVTAAVFGATLSSPAIGFFLALGVAAYPIGTFSLYLAVLLIAFGVLGHRVFIENLGATVLVLSTPILSGLHIVWAVPLLGGLWWGGAGGAWIGGAAALWGMLAAGMAGLAPDWLNSLGHIPSLNAVVSNYQNADSLETLLLLVKPLAANPTALLYHLLQIAGWAFTGALVGQAADRPSVQERQPLGPSLVGGIGAIALPLLHIILGLWLGEYTIGTLEPLWFRLAIATFTVALLVMVLEFLDDLFEHPLPPRRSGMWERSPESSNAFHLEEQIGPEPVPVPEEFPEWDQESEDPDDLIMLELD